MSDTPKKKDLTEFIAIVGVLLIIFCIWANYPHILKAMDEPTPLPKVTIPYKLPTVPEQIENSDKTKLENVGEKYGTYGDSYGSLNTLFSGLAFAVLIISMIMQRQELKAQREELAAQRGELTAQREEAEKSNKIAEGQRKITEQQATLIKQQIDEARIQNFYTSLFQYLKDLDLLIENSKVWAINGNATEHRKIITTFAHSFIENIPDTKLPKSSLKVVSSSNLKIVYFDLVRWQGLDFNNTLYLENILMILNFIIENQNITDFKKPIKTLLSHLDSELLLCLTWVAVVKNPDLKLMIENYGLLTNLTRQLEPEIIEKLKTVIDEKAFQEPV